MKAQASPVNAIVGTLIMLVLGLVILATLIKMGIINVKELLGQVTTTIGRQVTTFLTGSSSCSGLVEACDKWVKDGLGLQIAYGAKGASIPSYTGCSKDAAKICPAPPIMRSEREQCFKMCLNLIDLQEECSKNEGKSPTYLVDEKTIDACVTTGTTKVLNAVLEEGGS